MVASMASKTVAGRISTLPSAAWSNCRPITACVRSGCPDAACRPAGMGGAGAGQPVLGRQLAGGAGLCGANSAFQSGVLALERGFTDSSAAGRAVVVARARDPAQGRLALVAGRVAGIHPIHLSALRRCATPRRNQYQPGQPLPAAGDFYWRWPVTRPMAQPARLARLAVGHGRAALADWAWRLGSSRPPVIRPGRSV